MLNSPSNCLKSGFFLEGDANHLESFYKTSKATIIITMWKVGNWSSERQNKLRKFNPLASNRAGFTPASVPKYYFPIQWWTVSAPEANLLDIGA